MYIHMLINQLYIKYLSILYIIKIYCTIMMYHYDIFGYILTRFKHVKTNVYKYTYVYIHMLFDCASPGGNAVPGPGGP